MGMDISGLNPRQKVEEGNFDYEVCAYAGDYFRANIWAWRPLRLMCEWMNDYWELGLDMAGWQYNDGHGLKTQYECDLLAGALEDIDDYPCEWKENPFEADPLFDKFILYIDQEGTLKVDRTNKELDMTGVDYSITGEHYRLWLAFLWNCGGFAIR